MASVQKVEQEARDREHEAQSLKIEYSRLPVKISELEAVITQKD